MNSTTESRKFAYTASAVGVGMIFFTFVLSMALCDYRYGDISCPTPNASVLIGAGVGAITTAIFFYVIDRPAKLILEKYGEPSPGKYEMVLSLVAFVTIITGLSFLTSIIYCGFNYGIATCPTPDAEIWIGAGVGVLTTAIFFFMINKRVKSALERLGKLYVARTCVLNLMDIFGKESGKGRIEKSEENRLYFQTVLKTDYLDEFDNPSQTIKKIYDFVSKHEEINQTHDHTTCQLCSDIMDLIKKFNKEEENIIEKDSRVKKLDWMNR